MPDPIPVPIPLLIPIPIPVPTPAPTYHPKNGLLAGGYQGDSTSCRVVYKIPKWESQTGIGKFPNSHSPERGGGVGSWESLENRKKGEGKEDRHQMQQVQGLLWEINTRSINGNRGSFRTPPLSPTHHDFDVYL